MYRLSSVLCICVLFVFFFFFNDTATTEIYTLSLHDALPICVPVQRSACHSSVDQPHEVAVRRLDRRRVAALGSRREALRQRLDRGAVAEVLEPLLARDTDALLLLLDVRHTRRNARSCGRGDGTRAGGSAAGAERRIVARSVAA